MDLKDKTREVLKGEELNADTLRKYLFEEELILNSNSDLEVRQFTNGYSNLTYLLKIEEKEYVLRRPPFGAIRRGHDMSREYNVLRHLNKSFSKTPKVFAYTEDQNIIGASFYIMGKVEGIILNAKEARQRNITANEFPIIADSWLDTFVELHAVDYKAVGLGDLGRPDGYVERQVTNWGKQYLKAATEEVAAAKQVMEWMQNNQPKKYDFSLIHNDFKYDNIVFKDDNWKEVTAILDWEMCTLGDPLMDLGTSIAYWTMSSDGDMIKQGIPSPTVMVGNPSRTEIVEKYAVKSGRPINHLVFYYVYGLFKIAVIAQQIYYRFHKGLTTDPRFAHLNKASELLCMMALQAIQKNRIEKLF